MAETLGTLLDKLSVASIRSQVFLARGDRRLGAVLAQRADLAAEVDALVAEAARSRSAPAFRHLKEYSS